jgi:predicted Zn-dependent peptidase
VIKEELAMYRDQPQQFVHEMLNELLWPGHPLGRSLTGTEQTLDALQRPHFVEFLRRHYVAGNTLVTAAGQLDHRTVVRAVSRYARHFRSGQRSAFEPAPQGMGEVSTQRLTKTTEQTQIALGLRTCSRHDGQRFALRLLNTILGENMSSRLFQVLREDHGLAYSIGSSVGLFDDAGVLTISAGVETDRLKAALKLIGAELSRLTRTLPSTAELRRARDYLIGQMDLSLEQTSHQMMWIGEQLLAYRRIIPPEEIKQRLLEVKPTSVRAAAAEFLRPDRFKLALISPLKKTPGLECLRF